MTSNGRSASGLLCATRVYLLLGGVRGYDNVRKEQESSADDSRSRHAEKNWDSAIPD